jgi:hypothetical protein
VIQPTGDVNSRLAGHEVTLAPENATTQA